MSQNKKNEIIKGKSDILDQIIDKSKSFEEQIKLLKKREDLKRFSSCKDFGDKELKSKYLNLEFADMSNETDKKLFEQIFGHTLYDKLYEMGPFNDWVIQPSNPRINLINAIKLILNLNKTIQLDLV